VSKYSTYNPHAPHNDSEISDPKPRSATYWKRRIH